MDENRFYDYSGNDREGERDFSENYLNRHVKKSSRESRLCDGSVMIGLEMEISQCKNRISELQSQIHYNSYSYIVQDIRKKIYDEKVKIKQLQMKMANLEVKDYDSTNPTGGWYAFENDRVTIKYLADGREETFVIKKGRANVFNHEISSTSAMAKAIMGKAVGAVAYIATSAGKKGVKIVSINKAKNGL